MDNFSFGTTAGTSQSTAQPKLAGNAIYEVTFDGCEIKDVQGVKDPNITYKQLILKFKNEEGVFEHTVWEPKADGGVRKESEFTKDGKINKIAQPSEIESMMLLFKHVIDAVRPDVALAIDKKEKSFSAPSWDKLRELVIKMLDPQKGKATMKIKLLKNKSGDAVFPGFFAGLTKEGVAYVKNNFIGPKIAFTPYEIDRMNKENNAKPSSPATYGDFAAPGTENLSMDFDLDGI